MKVRKTGGVAAAIAHIDAVAASLRQLDQTQSGITAPQKRLDDDHPLVWWHTVGKGRVVYSALGHVPEVYGNPDYRQLVKAAVVWVNPDRS